MYTKVLSEEEKTIFEYIYQIKCYRVLISKSNNDFFASIDGAKPLEIEDYIARIFKMF